MGSLAIWGALGGLGKGEVEDADAQRKIDAQKMENDRASRLAAFAQAHEDARQDKALAHSDTDQDKSIAATQANLATSEAGSKERTQMEVTQRDSDSKTRSDAMIKIGAGHDAARTAAAAAAKNAKDGWSQKVLKMSGFDPASHMPTENDTVAVTHPAYGTFIQSGDKFVPQGTPPASISRAPIKAVNDLLVDPSKADDFVSAYHYLPAPYFKVIAAKGQMKMASEGPDVNAQQDAQDAAESSSDPAEAGRSPAQVAQDNLPAQ